MTLLLPWRTPGHQAEPPPSSFPDYCSSDKYQGHKASLETPGTTDWTRAEPDTVLVLQRETTMGIVSSRGLGIHLSVI